MCPEAQFKTKCTYWAFVTGDFQSLIISDPIWLALKFHVVVSWKPGEALEKICLALFPLIQPTTNLLKIGHFRVPKTLTFKIRLGAQPFLWKWVLFAWEWKMISISKVEHLPSFWNRGPGELGNVRLNPITDLESNMGPWSVWVWEWNGKNNL